MVVITNDEEMVVITKDGAEWLSKPQKEIYFVNK